MSTLNPPVLVGSIIHLLNGVPDGGYLDMRGWVTDKTVIDLFYSPHIQGLVSTHKSPNRLMGSGSWMVLSAEGAPAGEPLKIGDKVHLLNMYLGAGYLDSFEWVKRLKPFENYPMTIGVFTANVPKREGGPTGTWTVRSATGNPAGSPLVETDTIWLENGFPNAGFLQSYGKVTDHPLFSDYEGQQKFVFTAPLSASDQSSPQWTIRLDNFVENLYEVQTQWGGSSAPWHEGGIFKMGDRPGQPIVKLSFISDKAGNLSGKVTYKGESPTDFSATHLDKNLYQVKTGQDKNPSNDLDWQGKWQLGFRDSQPITRLDLESDGTALTGTITYSGEYPIRFKAVRQVERQKEVSQIYYDFFHHQLSKGRTTKLEGVIDTTHRLLSDTFAEISGISLDGAIQLLQGADYDKLLDKANLNQGSVDSIDYDFQLKQLLNLHTLSNILNSFFRETIQELLKRSSEKHQRNRTIAPLHYIRTGYQHIANDHEIIQQAIIQRRWNKHGEQKYCISEQAVELLVMDKLAIKAIAPFQHLLSEQPELAVITYLSDKTHIHHLPYTNQFILVGISYDRVPPADSLFDNQSYIGKNFYASELMAIPHEVGHYVYEHGRLKNGETFSAISQKFTNNPYYHWCEEIFADLYGCLVAGPLSALGLQALLVSLDRNRAWKDDEDHPTPLVRLFILADMIRVLEEIVFKEMGFRHYVFSKMAHKLDEDWAKVLEQWGYERMGEGSGRPHRIYLSDSSNNHFDKVINIKRVIETVRPIIIVFATHLVRELDKDSWATTPWTKQDYDSTEPYNQEMATLSGRDFARGPVKQKALLHVKAKESKMADQTEDEQLQWYLDNWDNRGPHGWGGH